MKFVFKKTPNPPQIAPRFGAQGNKWELHVSPMLLLTFLPSLPDL